MAAIGLLIRIPIIGNDVWPSLFFYRNYWPVTDNSTNVMTAHFWSLSLEEQFYLALSPVLVLVGRKWALRIAIAGAYGVRHLPDSRIGPSITGRSRLPRGGTR